MSDEKHPTHDEGNKEVEPLRPSEGYSDWRICLNNETRTLAQDFAQQFRLQLEDAVAALLLTAAHSLGESFMFELPHADITPPFNLLAITPEVRPVWAGVPLRFLSTGIEKRVEQELLLQRKRELVGRKEEAVIQAVVPEKWLRDVQEAAGLRILRQIVETLVCDQVRPPFASPPIDRTVSLVTPHRGMLRTLAQLSPLERLYLEDSLLGAQTAKPLSAVSLPGRPAFFWQVPDAEAHSFFRQHGHWLRDIPFVLLRAKQSEFPCLDAEAPVIKQFARLSELLFRERHAGAGNQRRLHLRPEVAKPVTKFIEESARTDSGDSGALFLRGIADLGLRFTLTLMRLENSGEVDPRLVECGLELAKFYGRRRIDLLSAFDWSNPADPAESADLDDLERRAFLKICESGGITRANLRKSFHKLSSSERDVIVAKLLEMKLIRAEGRILKRNAA